jgi:glucose-1-phosphate cytidylyltransferase
VKVVNVICVILAGGLGTRMAEYTSTIPKPMVALGGKPLIEHIMNIYSNHGVSNFILAVGYKKEIIKDYFLNYEKLYSDLEIDLGRKSVNLFNKINSNNNWNVKIIDTGLKTLTGGRLKRVANLVSETFFVTYGDGVGNIDISRLLEFHKSHGKNATMTVVQQTSRFGRVKFDTVENSDLSLGEAVRDFSEKPFENNSWINAGFFVFNKKVLDFIENDESSLEQDLLKLLAESNELMAFKHQGFWRGIDSAREVEEVNRLIEEGNLPWLT